jgi:hypothetical protein
LQKVIGFSYLALEKPIYRKDILDALGLKVKTHPVLKVLIKSSNDKILSVTNQGTPNMKVWFDKINKILQANESNFEFICCEKDRCLFLEAEKRLADMFFPNNEIEMKLQSPQNQLVTEIKVNWLSEIPEWKKQKLISIFARELFRSLGIKLKLKGCYTVCTSLSDLSKEEK